jgi:hypothetical protein
MKVSKMTLLIERVRRIYSWPSGSPRALGYACIVTVILVIGFLSSRWQIALLFWPILWLTRIVVLLVMRIPQATQRNNKEHETK